MPSVMGPDPRPPRAAGEAPEIVEPPEASKAPEAGGEFHALTLGSRLRRWLVGGPRDLSDSTLFHRMSLVPFLAWVGLGADGLSSSAYGPEEAFRTVGAHTYLALGLAAMTAGTILVISRVYSHIIEAFPRGGGGYVVATKLIGEKAGVVSGCALLVDYVFTITISIAAAGDALFSILPLDESWKLPVEVLFVVILIVLNIRGVRESILVLLPIFIIFLATHAVLILGGLGLHLPEAGETLRSAGEDFRGGLATLGWTGLILLFLHAYSLGGGTYTGIEAVSNGLINLRAPRVRNGQRTMLYMALSLAFTAAGLLISYLLWRVEPVAGKTMNAVLAERFAGGMPGGTAFVVVTLLAEGALLVVAAQAGFIAGPRVLANMAVDSWMPRRFATLSDRLTTQNGILLMGAAALAALLYTRGAVRLLVVMYSINVFLTFSLSTFAMLRAWLSRRERGFRWWRRAALFTGGFVLCATILAITTIEKFREGGWLTLVITSAVVAVCFLVRWHYRQVAWRLGTLYSSVEPEPYPDRPDPGVVDPRRRTAAVLVSSFGGLGIHTVTSILRMFPESFHNMVFLSVGVLDSGSFKDEAEIDTLAERTEAALERYVRLARTLGVRATQRFAVGTDVVAEAEKLCLSLCKDFPDTTFFIGKVIFKDEAWYHRWLHNETAYALQKRLEWAGKPMVILPARVT
jgi:amino acid permease